MIVASRAADDVWRRTVWYELLYGEWPFKGQPPEVIVWQVSRGIKPSLSNLQASKDVKVCIHVAGAHVSRFMRRLSLSGNLDAFLVRLSLSPSFPPPFVLRIC